MALKPGDVANFETLKKAFKENSVALVECKDKKTGEYVAVVCAVGQDGEELVISPFAKFFADNPYEEVDPPA